MKPHFHPTMKSILPILLFCILLNDPLRASAEVGQKPNVILIIVDDLNDYLGCLGGHPQAKSPRIDQLARQGVLFSNAHASAPVCNPSRTSMLLGLHPHRTSVLGNDTDWRKLPCRDLHPSLPSWLRQNGYITAAGGKVFHANHGGPTQMEGGAHGLAGYDDPGAWTLRFPRQGVQSPKFWCNPVQNFTGLGIWDWDWKGFDIDDSLHPDGQTVEWATRVLPQLNGPFFLSVGLVGTHLPWYCGKKYFEEFPLAKIRRPDVLENDLDDVPAIAKAGWLRDGHHDTILKKGLWEEALQAYLAEVLFVDTMVGKLIDALDASPSKHNTYVILTSDNGWYLGEKQRWHKGGLWEETTRVPLIIRTPTGETRICREAVSLVDIYPTIMDLTGVAPPPAKLDGSSLASFWDSKKTRTHPGYALTATPSGKGTQDVSFAIRDSRWRYIHWHDGSEELYDHDGDPNEWTNLAGKSEFEPTLNGFRKKLPDLNAPDPDSPSRRR